MRTSLRRSNSTAIGDDERKGFTDIGLTRAGTYVQVLTRSDVPKFKSNNRLEGTPEENTAVVRGTVAHFGIWLVDEASMILTLRTEGNMFPNLTGTDSARSIAVAGDELRLSNPAGTGGKVEVVMKRAM